MNSYSPCKYLVDDEVSKSPKTKTPKTKKKKKKKTNKQNQGQKPSATSAR